MTAAYRNHAGESQRDHLVVCVVAGLGRLLRLVRVVCSVTEFAALRETEGEPGAGANVRSNAAGRIRTDDVELELTLGQQILAAHVVTLSYVLPCGRLEQFIVTRVRDRYTARTVVDGKR